MLTTVETKVKSFNFWGEVKKPEIVAKEDTSLPSAYEPFDFSVKDDGSPAKDIFMPFMQQPSFKGGSRIKYEMDYVAMPKHPKFWHFHPMAFVEQMKRTRQTYKLGDKGLVVMEINLRLSGFGGVLPSDEFTDLTEKGVKQFQKDYMKLDTQSGVVDYKTMDAIEEFSEKYRENLDDYKCPCGECGGFGKGQYKDEYNGSQVERNHKYEYPGIHMSLLWAVCAARFYLTEKLDGIYTLSKISAGYRCWIDNVSKNRNTTNHMGKAVDLHFFKNGVRTYESKDMDELREKIFCECLGAPKQGGNSDYKFGWLRNKLGLEPAEFEEGKNDGATTWVHLDVREFRYSTYLKDHFFYKTSTSKCLSQKMIDIIEK